MCSLFICAPMLDMCHSVQSQTLLSLPICPPPPPPPPLSLSLSLTLQSLDWCIESAGLLSEFDLLSSSQDFNPAAAIVDIDRFLDENPPPSAENQQTLVELAEVTENHWAKQNALFAYNRVMEISERFSYHSQILESMVAGGGGSGGGGRGKQVSGGIGLPRVPVSSSAAATAGNVEQEEEEEEGEEGKGGQRVGVGQVDGPNGVIRTDSRGSTPDLSDSDDQTDAVAARTKSLRYVLYLYTT